MPRFHPFLRTLLAGIPLGLMAVSCQREIDQDDPIDLAEFTEAQFDPTNPIPVLQLTPSPTGLAQCRPGDVRELCKTQALAVPVQECEKGQSTKQCLAFVDGWPTTTPVTLFFSKNMSLDSITGGADPTRAGVKIFELSSDPTVPPAPVLFTAVEQSPRPPPPVDCMTGGNGTLPPKTYSEAQIPAGVAVVLTPSRALKPKTNYVLFVESSETGGVRATDAPEERVVPSGLFSLMNQSCSNPPVEITSEGKGNILSGLLRSQVQSGVIRARIGEKVYGDLSADEKETVDGAVEKTARESLIGLYRFFNGVIAPFVGEVGTSSCSGEEVTGLFERENLVFANAWTTGSDSAAAPQIEFAPPAPSRIPFPNVQLFTSSVGPSINDVQVALTPCVASALMNNPNPPAACALCNPVSGAGCDSPTAAALKGGLNTLNGFSLLGPFVVSANTVVDTDTLDDNVYLFELDGDGNPVSDRLAVRIDVTSSTITNTSRIAIYPNGILKQNTSYAVGITKGVKDIRGTSLVVAQTYSFLKSPTEIITAAGVVNEQFEPILQCSTVSKTGKLATDAELATVANQLEKSLARPRWQTAFRAFETKNIMRQDLLMAWTHKTQDISGTISSVRNLIPMWEQLLPLQAPPIPRIREVTSLGPINFPVTGSATISAFFGVQNQFCTPLALDAQTCGVVTQLLTSGLGEIRRYEIPLYRVLRGNPFVPTEGSFDMARFSAPVVQKVPIYVITPNTPEPANGYPVVMFQHGFTSNKEAGFAISNSLAMEGHAVVLMDAIWHGERASDLFNDTVTPATPCVPPFTPTIVDPDGVSCTIDPSTGMGPCVGGCDGFADASGTGALAPSPFTIRDGLRQSMIDYLALIRVLTEESGAGEPLEYLDVTQLRYAGQSLGGIVGGNLVGYAPEIERAALNVAGGGLVNLIYLNPRFASRLNAGLVIAGVCAPNNPTMLGQGCQPTPDYLQFLVVSSWVMEPGDPLVNSLWVHSEHNAIPAFGAANLLLQKSVPDTVVPNPQTDALALSYGFINPETGAALPNFQTFLHGAMATDCHSFLLRPDPACGNGVGLPGLIDALCHTLGAQRQVAGFLADMTIGPTRSDPLPPVVVCP